MLAAVYVGGVQREVGGKGRVHGQARAPRRGCNGQTGASSSGTVHAVRRSLLPRRSHGLCNVTYSQSYLLPGVISNAKSA